MEKRNIDRDFVELADKIESLNPLILSEWQKSVRTQLEQLKRESQIILIDHMPEILKRIEESLRLGVRDDMELARAHGFQRAVLTQFSIADVLNEYSILRETLISYLYPIGNLECTRYLHWYIDTLSKYSVLEFINSLPTTSSRIKDPLAIPNENNQLFS